MGSVAGSVSDVRRRGWWLHKRFVDDASLSARLDITVMR